MFRRKSLIAAITLMLLVSMMAAPKQAEAAIPKSYSEPMDLGQPVVLASLVDSTFGVEDGRQVIYTVTFGSPGVFNVVDIQSNELLRSFPLPGVHDSWSHLTLPDGSVYVGTAPNGELFRYSPVTKEVESVGRFAGQRALYGLTHDEHGNVYGGTYPGGKVFKFDPNTGEFTDYGQMVPLQEYVRSSAYYKGHVYAGIGTVGDIVKLNVETGEKMKLPLPDLSGDFEVPQVGSMDIIGDYLFAFFGSDLVIYDLVEEKWLDHLFTQARGLRVAEGPEGSHKAYFIDSDRLMEFDLLTEQVSDTGITYGTYLRNAAWVEVEGDPDLPGLSLVTPMYYSGLAFMNLETKVVKSITMPLDGQPVPIRVIGQGPDGGVYMSGYPGGRGAKYDPATGETEHFNLGQAEGMAYIGDKLYMGIYPGADIIELDVTKPIGEGNPKSLFRIPGQDRPFGMAVGGGKLFIGTIPDYGKLQGALTVYEPATGEHQIYENVIHNQSIVSMAYKDGLLYGGTSVHGGEGIDPSETEAKMFVWDVAKGEKIAEFMPELPEAVSSPKMISGLVFGPDGLLWAAADGIIFALDPETLEVVKSKTVYPGVTNYGKWVPIYSYIDDGILYSTAAGHLTAVRLDTLEHVKLADNAPLMVLGDDGSLYYVQQSTHLYRIDISEGVTLTDVYVPIPVNNAGFEEPVVDGKIPGWEVGYQTELTSYEISSEQAYSGSNSLKLVDQAQNPHTIAMRSEAFEVVPGTDYSAGAYVYLAEGRALFGIEFYDANGTMIHNAAAQITENRGQWQYVEITVTAPGNAVTAKVVPFISQFWMGTIYYDEISLRYKLNARMADAAWLQAMVEQYAASGDVDAPLAMQLTNFLNQAVQHLENGDAGKAVQRLGMMLRSITQPAMQKFISPDAKQVLETGIYLLQMNWTDV